MESSGSHIVSSALSIENTEVERRIKSSSFLRISSKWLLSGADWDGLVLAIQTWQNASL